MSGMQVDEADARLLQPVTERIIECAFRLAKLLTGKGGPVSDEDMRAMERRLDREAGIS
jgi:hypothetical protein